MNRSALANAFIVIARAEGRGEALRDAIRAQGGDALLLPVIAIRPLPAPSLPDETPDWIIFASVAAVEHGLATCRERMTERTRVAAIGASTAAALAAAGMTVDAVPDREESEGLLALPAFADTDGAVCWIVRGRGGRELIADTLIERGATVHRVEVYERVLPKTDLAPLMNRWRNRGVDAVVVSSAASLSHLHALLDAEGRRYLGETQLVMPTERMLKLALELDIRPAPIVAAGASDDAQLAALARWWRERHQDSR